MFGYLIPYKNELKVRDLTLWEATYCGVCHAIGKNNGQAPRLALQYDMASLALVLMDLSGDSFEAKKKACPTHLVNKKPAIIINNSLTYCADVTTLLTHHKLDDMWHDEKKLYAPPAKLLIHRGYKKAKKSNPHLASRLKKIMNELYQVEKNTEVSFDVPASLSGDLMHAVANNALNIKTQEKKALTEMMKNLGMWIYLADAMEDIQKDIKKGNFNPLVREGMPKKELTDSAKEVMTFALSRALLAYNLLPLEKSAAVMDNIIRYSLPMKQNMIVSQVEKLFDISKENQ